MKFPREFSQMFENKTSVSMKSRRRFLHLNSFSDSDSFMTAGPDVPFSFAHILMSHVCVRFADHPGHAGVHGGVVARPALYRRPHLPTHAPNLRVSSRDLGRGQTQPLRQEELRSSGAVSQTRPEGIQSQRLSNI